MASPVSASSIAAMSQIPAATAVREFEQNHSDPDTAALLVELDKVESRKHVRRAMDRVARRLGFDDCDDLIANQEEPKTPELPLGQKVDLSDLDLSSRDGWLEARKRAATAKHTRPDFATVDWDAMPTYDRTPPRATCPRCSTVAEGRATIGAVFGTRRSKTFSADLGPHRIETNQSLCRACRAAHKKARKAASG